MAGDCATGEVNRAQLDERMQAQLNSLFEAWLSEQLNQLDAVRIQNTPALV